MTYEIDILVNNHFLGREIFTQKKSRVVKFLAKKILTKNAIDWMSGEAKPWVFTFGKIGFNVGT